MAVVSIWYHGKLVTYMVNNMLLRFRRERELVGPYACGAAVRCCSMISPRKLVDSYPNVNDTVNALAGMLTLI
jgi:hypothetical protein